MTSLSARRTSIPKNSAPTSPEPPVPPLIVPDLSPVSIHSSFYLTNGDNPDISIISEVLDVTNYDNWSIAMNIALDAKNKLVFVDGTLQRPEESNRNYRIWSRCNSMVKS